MLRHRWKILFGLATAFVLVTVIEVATTGNGPKREVEAYKKSLKAKGEKLEISELLPPPIPPEQNGADIVNEALGMLAPEDQWYTNTVPAMVIIAPRKAIICFEQPDIHGFTFANSWSNELAVVARDRPITELLRQITEYPAIDLHLNYENWSANGRYTGLLALAYRLSAEAMCDLRQGDAASAGTNISTMLAIVSGTDDEQLENFQNIRIIMTRLAADTTWELLQSSNVSDAVLTRLQMSWKSPEYIHAMENAVAMQRGFYESQILKMRASYEYFSNETGGTEEDVDWSAGWRNAVDALQEEARLKCAKSMYRASWTYSDELSMLKEQQTLLQTLRTVETNQFFLPAYTRMTNELSAIVADEPHDWLVQWDDYDLHHMYSYSGKSFEEDAVSRTLEAEATRRMTIAAIALKRYQLKHGDYPSSLADLVPQFVAFIPRDPVDGKPLRYRSIPGGSFLLYSIGKNGKDDGGDGTGTIFGDPRPGLIMPQALDWVWPQPATAAEIQYFYAHPPTDAKWHIPSLFHR